MVSPKRNGQLTLSGQRHIPMKKLFTGLLIILCTGIAAQERIGQSRNRLEQYLKSAYPGISYQYSAAKDSLQLSPENEIRLIFTFDDSGSCTGETTITRCDSCLNGLLNAVLAKKKYGWKKINENQYVSRFEDYLMIELFPDEKTFSFSVLHTTWSRELYDLLMKN